MPKKVWIKIALLVLLAQAALAAYPQRIVSGMPSVTEMLFALGLKDQIVGVTTNCDYPPEALEKEKVGGFFLNLEKVVSLKPDMVIMVEGAQKRDIERFTKFGLPVYAVDPNSVIEVMDTLVELGEVTGTRERAEELVKEIKTRILSIEAGIKDLSEKRVLVIVGYKPLIVVGGDNFIDDVLRYARAKNISADAKTVYPQYSFERLLEADPDYIIVPEGVVDRREIEKEGRWQSLAAVKNGKILFMDADVLSRPGPRVVEAIEQIAEFIHEKET